MAPWSAEKVGCPWCVPMPGHVGSRAIGECPLFSVHQKGAPLGKLMKLDGACISSIIIILYMFSLLLYELPCSLSAVYGRRV